MAVKSEVKAAPGERLSDVFNEHCPGRPVFTHLTSRWGMLIMVALRDGPMRFYLLRDRIGGISEKVLSQKLRELGSDGLVRRRVQTTRPPSVSYELTPLGEEAADVLRGVVEWINRRLPDLQAAAEGLSAGDGA